jgi:ketosteroid isomerase-like protein
LRRSPERRQTPRILTTRRGRVTSPVEAGNKDAERGGAVTKRDLSEFLPDVSGRPQLDFVREVLEARGDYEKFLDFFVDDAVLTVVGRIYDYAFSGVYRGRENIHALLRRIDAEIEMSDHKILNLVVDADKIGLRRSVLVRHRGTAAARRLILGNFVTMRDGKIAELHEYVDTVWLKKIAGEGD